MVMSYKAGPELGCNRSTYYRVIGGHPVEFWAERCIDRNYSM